MTNEPLMPDAGDHPIQEGFTFSQAALQDYADCARRFELRYIDQMVWPAVSLGPLPVSERRQQDARRFHRLVQQHMMGLPPARPDAMAGSPDLLRWWQNYIDANVDLDGFQLHAERTLVTSAEGYRLVAKFDLIAVRPGQALIYDWKTYARRPTEEQLSARWQTKVYRAVLVQAGATLNGGTPFDPSEIAMVYWFAEFPSDPARLEYDHAQYEQDRIAIGKCIREIAAGGPFLLTEDHSRCRFCAYRSLCGRGVEASLWTEAEADLLHDNDRAVDFGEPAIEEP